MIEFLINILQFVCMIIGCFIYIIVLASPGLNRYGAYNHCKTTDIKLPPPTPLPNNNKNKFFYETKQ